MQWYWTCTQRRQQTVRVAVGQAKSQSVTESGGHHIRHLQRLSLGKINSCASERHLRRWKEKWENCLNEVVITRQDVRNVSKKDHNARVQKSTHEKFKAVQRLAKRYGCLLSYSQAELGRELTQPCPRLLAEPCKISITHNKNYLHSLKWIRFNSPESFLTIGALWVCPQDSNWL